MLFLQAFPLFWLVWEGVLIQALPYTFLEQIIPGTNFQPGKIY